MSNLVFPTLPGKVTVNRSPYYATASQETLSGKELRSTWRLSPRTRYTLTFNVLRSAAAYLEYQQLVGFFQCHAGQWDSFLWVDPEDNNVTAHPCGVGNGSNKNFQLQRTLVPSAYLNSAATRSYWPSPTDGYEPVWEPDSAGNQGHGQIAVYKDGTQLTWNTQWSFGSNGLAVLTTAPANGSVITWTGYYYKRVRFASDIMSADRIVNQVWGVKQVDLVSVIP